MSRLVRIISGGVNQGKTSHLFQLYTRSKTGGGFISRKIFRDDTFNGYEIVNLESGEAIPFAFKKEYLPGVWDEACSIGPFSFSQKAFDYANSIMENLASKGASPVYIDEVGPLELRKEGFYNSFSLALEKADEVIVAIRTSCVAEAIKLFSIRDYSLTNCDTR